MPPSVKVYAESNLNNKYSKVKTAIIFFYWHYCLFPGGVTIIMVFGCSITAVSLMSGSFLSLLKDGGTTPFVSCCI